MKKISNQETEDFITLPAKLEGSFRPYSWSLPPSTLEFSSHDVHVWLTKLNLLTTQVQQMAQCLSENELIRAGRFHFKQDRLRFIVCRAVLRMILGRYLHIEPNRVQFSYGPHGKPYLEETVGDGTLQFNLGHSNDIALYAFTRCREIGVDIEYIRDLPDADQIAASFFSAGEIAALQALPANQRQMAFFACWTSKEAYVKAVGKGLAQPLDQFEVSLAPGEPAGLLNVKGAAGEASRWSLNTWAPAPGYVAALAVKGHNWQPTYWQFPKSTSEVHLTFQTPLV